MRPSTKDQGTSNNLGRPHWKRLVSCHLILVTCYFAASRRGRRVLASKFVCSIKLLM